MQSFLKSLTVITLIFVLAGCSENDAEPIAEITVGALIPTSGTFGQQGTAVLRALEMAVEDANENFESQGIDASLAMIHGDTETDPTVARELLETLIDNGVRIVVGPLTSAELQGCQDLIDASDVIIISPSSTSMELAVADDRIYRLVPDDSRMADAIAEVAWFQGITRLAVLHREDVWGYGLCTNITDRFEALGGTIIGDASYYSYRNSLYQEALDSLLTGVSTAIDAYGADQVGLQVSSFDEGADILALAATADSLFREINWLGSDGIATNSYLLTDTAAVDFSRATNFSAPIYAIEETAAYADLKLRLESVGAGTSVYSYISYDALRIAAEVLANGDSSESIDGLNTRLFDTLNGYEGVTGSITLNDNGDRATGAFNFWRVSPTNLEWELAFVYQSDGTITEY